jgi:enamine deaminase RidA (YjgF/YER057c/UK114 family)
MSITRHHKNARMSQGVSWNGMFVTSAQVAKDFDLDAAGQTREVLDKIDALLAEQGYDKSNIVSATIWLADIADYAAMNSVWDAWVSTDELPARACVEARFSSPRIKVEIQIMAAG